MYVVEVTVDRRKSALVGNVPIDLDLAVQVIRANGLRITKSLGGRTGLRRDPGSRFVLEHHWRRFIAMPFQESAGIYTNDRGLLQATRETQVTHLLWHQR